MRRSARSAACIGRQSLDGSPDFGLDLRGFGTNSSQNLVILVDGVRMNENELAGAVLSSIPVDTVERIEITRGGSSVLYGEGATGGVINIFTRRGTEQGYHGSLALEGGQFGQHDARAALRHGEGPLSFDLRGGPPGDRQRPREQRVPPEDLQRRRAVGAGRDPPRPARRERAPEVALARFADPGAVQARIPHQRTRRTTSASSTATASCAFAEHRIGSLELAAELSHREREVAVALRFQRLHLRSHLHQPPDPVLAAPAPDRPQQRAAQRIRRRRRPGPLGARTPPSARTQARIRRRSTPATSCASAAHAMRAWPSARATNASRRKKRIRSLGVPNGEQSQNAWSLEGSIDPLRERDRARQGRQELPPAERRRKRLPLGE